MTGQIERCWRANCRRVLRLGADEVDVTSIVDDFEESAGTVVIHLCQPPQPDGAHGIKQISRQNTGE